MIIGLHALFYSREATAARAFLRDVLGLPSIDAGGGWLIFAAPPTELAVHPTDDGAPEQNLELHFMCTDIEQTVADLRAKNVEVTKPISDEGYGLFTAVRLPGGGEFGLYEPRHPTALDLVVPSATVAKRAKTPKRKQAKKSATAKPKPIAKRKRR